MVVRLDIETWVIGKGGSKRRGQKRGEWVGKEKWGLLGFVALVCGCISVVVEGACVRDCRGLGLCQVGTVGWSVGGECAGGRGSVVTGWGRIEGEGEEGGSMD
jgi:hypothetical protein